MKNTTYIIEVTTNDERETLLKTERIKGWAETKKAIDYYKDLDFQSIKIDLYKEESGNITHCGNFTNKEKYNFTLKPPKKTNDNIILIIATVLLFPIMLFYNLIKDSK